ncbi:MAG: DUF2167 domain-containing protein [Alphaproteobacteria bacterium]|nr:DUF2167 domain-containing protein [Alphaproteobacteria bacterium]
MRFGAVACAFLACLVAGAAAADPPRQLTPQEKARLEKLQRIGASLHPQYGEVKVPVAGATLHLGKDYYYIAGAEARSVLVDAWENPPDTAMGVQGIVFPAGTNFMSNGWAAVISYEDSGFVDDKDARTADYGAMLKQAKDADEDDNAARKEKGYAPLHLVGWAQPPYYDQSHHTLVWARELAVDGAPEHTLNYDLRALGRRGVLSMNILAGMSQLDEVRSAAARLQNIGTFDRGARYQDYKAGSDKLAEYGVGGLVAAGIGVLAAKKLGLLALGLVFVKKFFAIILAGLAGAGAWFRRLFTGKRAEPAVATAIAADAPAPLPPPEGPAA